MHHRLSSLKAFVTKIVNHTPKSQHINTETMAAPRVFVTGVSGYLGGHTITRIMEKHPEWNVVALIRSEEQKKIVQARWPKIEVVIGDLDNRELLIEEGSKADVVLQTASSDHAPGVQALIEGLGHKKPVPGRFIHVSGTGMLNEVAKGFGNPSEKVYHDVADLVEITSFPIENHIHRDVDMAVLEANKKFNVPTAILSPPLIHGIGKGPIKTRSIQIPFLTDAILRNGKGFQVLEGQNLWNALHIDDAASAFILLVEEALKPNGGSAQWGSDGYYFAEAEEFKWGDISNAITKLLHEQGALKSGEVDKLSVAEASALHPWAPLLWGGNCRASADRIHALGWKAVGPSVFESLPLMVAEEVKSFGSQSNTTTFGK